MAALKEWVCVEHGEFEASHAICPAFGCASEFVTQEFRTPVSIGTQFKKDFDAGVRKSADMMGTTRLKTAKEGEASFKGRAENGQELLWGDQCKKVMGRSFAELAQVAQLPTTYKKRDGSAIVLTRNNGMREAATEIGVTSRRIPRAGEATGERKDKAAVDAMVA